MSSWVEIPPGGDFWKEENGIVTATRKWECDWGELFGPQRPVEKKSRYSDNRPPQNVHPIERYLICKSVSHVGEGANLLNGANEYGSAVVTATYSTLIDSGDTQDEEVDLCGMMETISAGLVWDSDGAPVDIPISRVVPMFTWSFSLTFPHAENRKVILAYYQGSVNAHNFKGCPPETVRFDGAKIKKRFMSSPSYRGDIDIVNFNFTINAYGWNNYPRGYEAIFDDIGRVVQPARLTREHITSVYRLMPFSSLIAGQPPITWMNPV